MRNSPVGIGIIGAGAISTTYLENLTRFPDVEVHFVADIDTGRARAQASRFGVPHAGTVDDLLNSDEIEIVVNLTVPIAHAPVAKRALEAGKSVWSEKPLALDRRSGEELIAEAAARGLRVASAPDTFLGPGIQSALRAINDGLIGSPVTARAFFRSPGPEPWHPRPDFYYAAGGGPLFDMAPYYLTALVQLLGPIAAVSATSTRPRSSRVIGSGERRGEEIRVEIDTQYSALLRFENGVTAQAEFSFDSPFAYEPLIEVTGSSGAITISDPNAFDGTQYLWSFGEDSPREIAADESNIGRGTGVVEMARAIRRGVPQRASGALAYHVLDVMISIQESAEERCWIDLASSVERPAPLPDDFDPRRRTVG